MLAKAASNAVVVLIDYLLNIYRYSRHYLKFTEDNALSNCLFGMTVSCARAILHSSRPFHPLIFSLFDQSHRLPSYQQWV